MCFCINAWDHVYRLVLYVGVSLLSGNLSSLYIRIRIYECSYWVVYMRVLSPMRIHTQRRVSWLCMSIWWICVFIYECIFSVSYVWKRLHLRMCLCTYIRNVWEWTVLWMRVKCRQHFVSIYSHSTYICSSPTISNRPKGVDNCHISFLFSRTLFRHHLLYKSFTWNIILQIES